MGYLLDQTREIWEDTRRKTRQIFGALKAFGGKHPWTGLIILIVAVGIVPFAHPVLADAGDAATSALRFVFSALNSILYWIAGFLVGINTLLSWLMIDFAKYNTFVTAQPVLIGWPLVRDVVNMFFIVVLLAVAFGTIIGYQKLHYKSILPKLLLMAVLINFSKTLVGVMIDFSQVLTLTFVNGFQAAAFGNVVKAFNLTNVLSIATDKNAVNASGVGVATGGQESEKIFISLIFGCVILAITGTVLLIMAIYFLVRIVMLWILLIFSPIAFFAYGLPDSIKPKISALTSGWWDRLASMLSGGPIVAFFLWLTFAVIQGSSNPFPGLYQTQSATEESSLNPVITSIGTPSNITTMMVAIIMLMTGLATAIKVSGEASPQLGKLANRISAAGGPGTIAARGLYGATSFATRKTAGAIDRRARVSERAGAQLLRFGQATGSTTLSRAGAGLVGIGAAERAETIAAFQKETKHLSPAQRLQALDAEIAHAEGTFGNSRESDALKVQKGLLMKDGASVKARSEQYEKEWLKKNKSEAVDGETKEQKAAREAAHEAGAKGYAEARATSEAGIAIAAAAKSAEASGDDKSATDLKDAQAKNPSLYNDLKQLSKVAGNKIDDYKQLDKDVKTEAWQDSGTYLAYMKSLGLVDGETGKMKDGYEESDAWKHLTQYPESNRTKFMTAHAKRMESADGQTAAKAQLDVMGGSTDAGILATATAGRYMTSIQGQNAVYSSFDGGTPPSVESYNKVAGRPREISGFKDLTSTLPTTGSVTRTTLESELAKVSERTGSTYDQGKFAKEFTNSVSLPQATYIQTNAEVYANPPGEGTASLDQLETVIRGQAMGIPAPATMRREVISTSLNTISSTTATPTQKAQAMGAISNINPDAIEKDPAVRKAYADAIDGRAADIEKMYTEAQAGDTAELKKLEKIIKAGANSARKEVAAATKAGRALDETTAKLDKMTKAMSSAKGGLKQVVRRDERRSK